MLIDYDSIHNNILTKSRPYEVIYNQIIMNGKIELYKPKLDLFMFTTKMIISQQISDVQAKKKWEMFCNLINSTRISIKHVKSKDNLEMIVTKLKISKRKISYILNLYQTVFLKNKFVKKLINSSEDEFRKEFSRFKGIGPWTCDMILIFFLQKLNIFPENDLVINKVKNKLLSIQGGNIDMKKEFSPYLSIFSIHLWKMAKRVL